MIRYNQINKKILIRFLKEKNLLKLINNKNLDNVMRLKTINNIDTEFFYYLSSLNTPLIRYDSKLHEEALYKNLEYFSFIVDYLEINHLEFSKELLHERLNRYSYTYNSKHLNSQRIIDSVNDILKKLYKNEK